MFWIIATILLGVIAIVSLIYNVVKDSKIDALEYEVSYLLNIIFYGHGDVVLRQRDNELTDKEVREIKDAWDKRIK
ncbi:hypothetical protein [Staphylococcus xylosus]|uniref:hypothetical protein n=1 Tax=Staphylococcus xylosus TaxID=1288 RepID=UPI001C1E4A4B|nr:hypothetical protein [Staphylococcus xylosus]MBU6132163.1 hypothetical protein [Staphylococcus xylosus]